MGSGAADSPPTGGDRLHGSPVASSKMGSGPPHPGCEEPAVAGLGPVPEVHPGAVLNANGRDIATANHRRDTGRRSAGSPARSKA